MAKNECERIIDQAIEQGHARGPVAQHCKKCSECAAAIACLLSLKTGDSPTSGLEPSIAYMASIEQKIGNISVVAASTVKISAKIIVAILVSTAVALVLVTGLLSSPSSAPENKTKITSAHSAGIAIETKDATVENDSTGLNPPIMQFKSPADDVEQ